MAATTAAEPAPASAAPQTSKATRMIATAELAQHNTPASLWVAIRGHVYDLTDFVARHPGGTDVLFFVAGRDATQLFEIYHPLKTRNMLHKYAIGTLTDNELPVFPPPSPFFVELKDRVDAYFKSSGQDPRYSAWTWGRYAVIYGMWFAAYYAQFYVPWVVDRFWAQVACAAVLGFFCAQIGLHPLHDASHCAMTHAPWMWQVLGATHDFLNGCSYVVWTYQHLLGHHPYTNIAGADPDILTGDPDVRRIKPSQRYFSHYNYQQWFVPVLYGVLGIKTRIQDVSIIYVLKSNDKIRINPMTVWHTAVFWLGKAFFVWHRIYLPLQVCSWDRVLALFLIADLVASYWLALTFQANHVVVETEWPQPDPKTNEMSIDWATMQVKTTQDYAHLDPFWTVATGALNYQTVHHLFPNISQFHYPALGEITKQVCKEHGIKYLVKDTFWEALGSHLGHLRILGLGLDVKKAE
ncbi:hypothetical protein GGF32_002358 [Allomyces javanicus]|nr:hypothetical protein GGF32_002358 [Allomyces javanicus]